MALTASVIIVWLVIGLVIGALARLLVPGRQHIGLIMTILIGVVAAIAGGLLTTAILGAGHTVITFIVALVAAALLVSAFTTRGYGRYHSRSLAEPDPKVAKIGMGVPTACSVTGLWESPALRAQGTQRWSSRRRPSTVSVRWTAASS